MIALRRLALASSVIAFVAWASASLSAQAIVFDPHNYVQNVLTAARALQQINNQITSLQNEAQMLVNQARNLANLPYSSLEQPPAIDSAYAALLAQAQRIAYDVQDIDRAFSTTYAPATSSQSDQALIDQRANPLAERRRRPAGRIAHPGDRRRQSGYEPHRDLGAGEREPGCNRRIAGEPGRQSAVGSPGSAARRSDRGSRGTGQSAKS